MERADSLSFPQSVLEYFQGYLGQPPYGFPEPLRTKILEARRLTKIEGRPGKSMESFDFKNLEITLKDRWGDDYITEDDVLSAALYPDVFNDFKTSLDTYGSLSLLLDIFLIPLSVLCVGDLSTLPTRRFLTPLQVSEEFSDELETGKTLIIKLVAIGPLHEESGTRDVYFSLNGEARVVSIQDTTTLEGGGSSGKKALSLRPKADAKNKGDVGAPMSGVVVEVRVGPGSSVKIGDPIAVMSAMKMETIVTATIPGTVSDVLVNVNDSLSAGDLIAVIKKE